MYKIALSNIQGNILDHSNNIHYNTHCRYTPLYTSQYITIMVNVLQEVVC